MAEELRRGDVVFVVAEGNAPTGVQAGSRPHLIISNNKFNRFSPVVTCVPLTSRCKNSPVHYPLTKEMGLDKDSYVLCEQITTVSKASITRVLCSLPDRAVADINEMLCFQLAL